MPVHKRKGKTATSRSNPNHHHRNESTPKKMTPRGSGGRFISAPTVPATSPAASSTPTRSAVSGKLLLGEAPENLRTRRSGTSTNDYKNIENSDEDGSTYEDDGDYEDNEQSCEPPLKAEDDDGDDEYSSLATTPAKTKKKSVKKAKQVPKMKYNKNKGARVDSIRFTTSQAMAQAADEFTERVAAFRGRKAFGGGNGRKHGRKLIRWTSATDQLLLLCVYHEFAQNKMELPYDAIAERMFPDKNATGGAIKERFAKLRTECLNRGSWVPPIIGKTPQGSRPDVRGVVRLAPGIDEGRFILWKEDASRLIDPKDINKAYIKAQAEGLRCPQRVWISKKAKDEFFAKNAVDESVMLSEMNALTPDDEDDGDDEHTDEDEYDEDDENDEEEYESDVDLEQDAPAVQFTTKRKTIAGPVTPNKKAKQAKKPKSRKNKTQSPKDFPAGSDHVIQSIEHDNHVHRGSDEEVRPARNIVVVRGVPQRVLQKYPAGIQGPGDDEYAEDELTGNANVMMHDAKPVLASGDDNAEEIAAFMRDDVYDEKPGLVFVPEGRDQHYNNQVQPKLEIEGNNFSMGLQSSFVHTNTAQGQDNLLQFDGNQLMHTTQDNMVNSVAVNYNLLLQNSQALDDQTMVPQQYGGFGDHSMGFSYPENPTGQNIMNHQSNVNNQDMDAFPDLNNMQVMSDWDGLQFDSFMDMLHDQASEEPIKYEERYDDYNI